MPVVKIVNIPVEKDVMKIVPVYKLELDEEEAIVLFGILCSAAGGGKYGTMLGQWRAAIGPKLPTDAGIRAPGLEGMVKLS